MAQSNKPRQAWYCHFVPVGRAMTVPIHIPSRFKIDLKSLDWLTFRSDFYCCHQTIPSGCLAIIGRPDNHYQMILLLTLTLTLREGGLILVLILVRPYYDFHMLMLLTVRCRTAGQGQVLHKLPPPSMGERLQQLQVEYTDIYLKFCVCSVYAVWRCAVHTVQCTLCSAHCVHCGIHSNSRHSIGKPSPTIHLVNPPTPPLSAWKMSWF